MPTYDYRCAANGRIVEVSHRMSEKLSTWGELCERANLERGDTPSDTPVQRLATGGNVITSNSMGSGFDTGPACGAGGCGGGMCGLN